MKGKPLHQWEYKGKCPKEKMNLYECKRCGFALIAYNSNPPAKEIQHLIAHNANLKRCF